MSLFVVRAFLRMRESVAGQKELSTRLTRLERKVGGHDRELQAILRALRGLIEPPETLRRRIGFRTKGVE